MIKDPRTRYYVSPAKMVWAEGTVEGSERLLRPHTGQVTLADGPGCQLKGKGAAVLLDFGKQLHGGVQLVAGGTEGNRPVKVRVRFGESATEAMGEPNQDHAIHDTVVQVPWLGSAEVGNTGYRFVRLDLAEEGTWVDLKAVRGVHVVRDLPYRGAFSCSDERLNRIWQTGAYTVHLNMQEYLWDGIKRDRLVWVGDMHPEVMVINTVFGHNEVVPRSLDLVRETTPLPNWMNGIPAYSLWWVLIQHAWYRYQGDEAYLKEQAPYLKGLVAELAKQVGAEGEERLPAWRFVDWPTQGNEAAIHAGLQGLLTLGMEAGAELLSMLGEPSTARQATEAAERLRRHRPNVGASKQSAALLALSGIVPAEEVNREVLARDPLAGVSTFYGYYVLQARAMAGDHAGAMELIRRYWGGMLDRGATTFWEDFDLGWLEGSGRVDELTPAGMKDLHADYGAHCYKGLRHSLCHGWAAGPTAWLTEHVLGLSPTKPGCREVRCRPNLGDLAWAEGTLPTPLGELHVRHERKADGEVETRVVAPEGVKVVEG